MNLYCGMFFARVKLCFTVSIYIYSLYLYIVRRLAEKRGARLKSGTLMKYRIFCGLIGVSLALSSFHPCSHVLEIQILYGRKG